MKNIFLKWDPPPLPDRLDTGVAWAQISVWGMI